MHRNLTSSFKINYTATAAATVTTEVATDAVDTAGYGAVTFIRSTSAARTLKLQGGTTSTNATNDITGASVTATAGTLVKIEVFRPPYRYVRLTSTEGVTSIFGDCVSILGEARDMPVSNDGDVLVANATAA